MEAPWAIRRVQIIPQPTNPLDKTTIFSIFPKEIIEDKITVFPGHFTIPPGSLEIPSRLVVGASSWWKEIHESEQLLEIPQHSLMMAKSIVNDYVSGMLGVSPDDGPGLFFIPTEITSEEAKKTYPKVFADAHERQKRWYLKLVNLADQLWARTNGNPLSISDDMRLAARMLGRDGKEWLQNFEAVQSSRCPACGTMRNSLFPVCPTCRAVTDPEKAKKLGIKFSE